jgi:protocatechuate 3,4-dioxygenase alpha subunit
MTSSEPGHPLVATSSQTVGPFFHVGPMRTDQFGRMVLADAPGEPIHLDVRVLDGDAEPVSDAMIELWQPAAGFGRLGTGTGGSCRFETVRPSQAAGTIEAPHINVCLFARGLLRHLYTRIYFEGDAGLEHDPLFSAVPEARRPTLLARPSAARTWEFVVRLQGDDETVFFDI